MNKQAFTTILLMLTVAPISAVLTLLSFFYSSNWGEISFINVLVISFFGLLTVPLWFTLIPALVIMPIYMQRQANNLMFHTMPITKFILLAIIRGGIGGIFVLSPILILSLSSSPNHEMHFINWLITGVVSGVVTGTAISFVYRKRNVQPDGCSRETG